MRQLRAEPPPATYTPARTLKKLHIYLIKPSQYDSEGYVVRHWRGVLPSNTLACLAGLTEDVMRKKSLGESLRVKLHLLDESVDRVPVERICRSQRGKHTMTIVGLVGVQTNQFPRAADLAMQFRRAGLTVMLGGFHVSGYLAMIGNIPPEIQRLLDAGVTIVKGEVEETWGRLLGDAVSGRLKPLYDFIDDKPDLYEKPLPVIRKEYLRKFVASNFGTLDCGRGCPFECSFCTIINVQGRKMRFRSPERIAEALRRNYHQHGISFYFITDDNFARNKSWEAIFDVFIRLREEEQIPLKFMMQVDVLSWKIKNFVAKAHRAGCTNVFIGMESVNTDNLLAAGKRQNHVEEYRQLIEAYRSAEISTHVGYIVGFPNDTADSLRRDVERLMQEVQPDHASFFILTPLPGSQDHLEMFRRGEWMHPDFNLYDSTHEVTRHPNFFEGALKKTYGEAWRAFYSLENMKAVLRRAPASLYWNHLFRFMWYKNSVMTEDRHPMLSGFFRLKGRTHLRPGVAPVSRWQYWKTRRREIRDYFAGVLRILLEMEELWLQTRRPSEAEQHIVEEINRLRAAARGKLRVADMQLAHIRAKMQFPTVRVPSKLQLLWAKWYPLLAPSKVYTRADLDSFWLTTKQRWHERQWLRIPPHLVAFNMFRDAQVLLHVILQLVRPR
ncbi:MAG: radical SAM protein [Acidobacteria bacterium]|nr:radical SAM protein [Acidobacteriota bacterium]